MDGLVVTPSNIFTGATQENGLPYSIKRDAGVEPLPRQDLIRSGKGNTDAGACRKHISYFHHEFISAVIGLRFSGAVFIWPKGWRDLNGSPRNRVVGEMIAADAGPFHFAQIFADSAV